MRFNIPLLEFWSSDILAAIQIKDVTQGVKRSSEKSMAILFRDINA